VLVAEVDRLRLHLGLELDARDGGLAADHGVRPVAHLELRDVVVVGAHDGGRRRVVHVDDVARGHLLALRFGRRGERYILGGQDLSLREILRIVGEHTGRPASNVRLPHWAVYPIAAVGEAVALVTKREPRATLDGVRMSKKHMYFSSAKAERELGYRWRAPQLAIGDAIDWFKSHGYF